MSDVREDLILFTQCRVCLSLGPKMVNIFSSTSTLSSISSTIMECVPVYMCEEDALPHTICQLCLEKLEHAFVFRNMCLNSDIKLRNSNDELKEEGDFFLMETNSLDNSDIQLEPNFETDEPIEKDTTGVFYEPENVFLIPDSEILEEGSSDVFYEPEIECLILDSEIIKAEETEHNEKNVEQPISSEVKFKVNVPKKPKEQPKHENDFQSLDAEILGDEENVHTEKQIDQLKEIKADTQSVKKKRKHTRNTGSPKSQARTFSCEYCNKTYTRIRDLLTHNFVHTGIRYKPGPLKLNPRPYACEKCNKTYKRACDLRNHQAVHTGERHNCNICGRGFILLANLTAHMNTHSSERNHSCEFCGLTFKAANVLKIHRTIHLNLRPFECELCDKKFRLKKGLINHTRTHTGERPFPCNVCGKFYSKPEHATRHALLVHSEKPYKCKICGQAFLTHKLFELHQITKHGGIKI